MVFVTNHGLGAAATAAAEEQGGMVEGVVIVGEVVTVGEMGGEIQGEGEAVVMEVDLDIPLYTQLSLPPDT